MSNVHLPPLSGPIAANKVRLNSQRSSSALATSIMGTISGRVAGSVSRALHLVDEDNEGGGQHGGQQDDPYAIDELVNDLTKEFPANAVAVGLVSRSLHAFAHEVAALIMARPQSSSLAHLERIIAEQDAASADANMADLAAIIAKTTSKLQGAG